MVWSKNGGKVKLYRVGEAAPVTNAAAFIATDKTACLPSLAFPSTDPSLTQGQAEASSQELYLQKTFICCAVQIPYPHKLELRDPSILASGLPLSAGSFCMFQARRLSARKAGSCMVEV